MEADRVPGRECGSCSMCCKVMAIDEIAKPIGTWCWHVRKGNGCAIYADRPPSCVAFGCGYLHWFETGEHWFPARAKMVIEIEDTGRLLIRVDGSTPNVWRAQPYYDDIKRWAWMAHAHGQQTAVLIGRRMIMILPEHDIDVGIVAEDEAVVASEKLDGSFEITKIKREDPRFARIKFGTSFSTRPPS